jgi:hypothetical protein
MIVGRCPVRLGHNCEMKDWSKKKNERLGAEENGVGLAGAQGGKVRLRWFAKSSQRQVEESERADREGNAQTREDRYRFQGLYPDLEMRMTTQRAVQAHRCFFIYVP